MNETILNVSPVPARTWLAVTALGISAFSIVTSELAPVGMLSTLAKDLNQTESGAGLVVTAYGWIAALAALLSGAMPARIPRKALLVGLMFMLGLSCIAATRTHSMSGFMSARMAGALAHGAFWALIGTVAAQLVPAEKLGLATSVIFGGVSAASVLGVPLSSLITGMTGWRSAFTAISLLALATACVLFWTLPTLSAPKPLRRSVYWGIFKNPLLLSLYGATACIISAHFAAFTYLEPLLMKSQGVPAGSISGLLLMSGLSGLVGNIIAGKLIDRHIKGLISISLLLSAGALGMLGMGSAAPLPFWFTGMLLAIWGAGVSIVFVGLQTWLLRSAGDAAQPASAIYVAIFNAAIGVGALAGGQMLAIIGFQGMALLAASIFLCGMTIVLMLKVPRII
ncbi:MFS transporter [Rouxiella sp. T17]|uniref:MFS transporter n=1 Tax=Rouxiella sp. T17 TaxID=3085684 RepID=UPI002FC58B58